MPNQFPSPLVPVTIIEIPTYTAGVEIAFPGQANTLLEILFLDALLTTGAFVADRTPHMTIIYTTSVVHLTASATAIAGSQNRRFIWLAGQGQASANAANNIEIMPIPAGLTLGPNDTWNVTTNNWNAGDTWTLARFGYRRYVIPS